MHSEDDKLTIIIETRRKLYLNMVQLFDNWHLNCHVCKDMFIELRDCLVQFVCPYSLPLLQTYIFVGHIN